MLWATWTLPPLVSSLVLCSAILAIWAADPRVTRLNLLSVLACLLLTLSLAPERASNAFDTLRALATAVATNFNQSGLYGLALTNANMIVSGAALVWLLRRAVQTLWKPVPELINILGVEVPAPPDVSLTAIGADKATITWTRPPSNRPVEKYIIQVNGVNVGESATSHDTFITVSGLKPNHFYNVRIIAVGSNNFQAGSRVLRLRTFGSDGRPRLGSSRLPSGFTQTKPSPRRTSDAAGGDDNGTTKQFVTSTFGVAQPISLDASPALSRDGSSVASLAPSSRRNTVNRRHSPSTASLDQQQSLQATSERDATATEAEMAELNQRYLNLRKETEETALLIRKEDEDMKRLLGQLEKEKQAKRKEHKGKEGQTEKLKREQGATERAMRAANQRRAQKEKRLKEKSAELNRLHENIAKWDKSIKEMQEEQQKYNQQRTELDDEHDKKANELRDKNKEAQAECTRLETELKEKRQQVKCLEEDRKTKVTTSTGDDAEWRGTILTLRKGWQRRELEFRNQLLHENRRQQGLDSHMQILATQLQHIPQQTAYNPYNTVGPMAAVSAANPPNAIAAVDGIGALAATSQLNVAARASPPNTVNPASSVNPNLPSFDFDPVVQNQLKRRSRASNSLSSVAAASPAPPYSIVDVSGMPPSTTPPYAATARPTAQSSFLTGPFMGSPADHPSSEETGFKALTMGAPLSPSATSLLPSNIFNDDDPPSPSNIPPMHSPFVPAHTGSPDIINNLNITNTNGSSGSGSNSNSFGTGNGVGVGSGFGGSTAVPSLLNNDAQSPTTSSRSMSILSSPHGSSQNLPFPPFGVDPSADGRSPHGDLSSPIIAPVAGQSPSSTRFGGIFSFPRSRVAKALDEGGPTFGSLKHGQSQSFPRQVEDPEFSNSFAANKSRRISLSSWSMFNRSSAAGGELPENEMTAAAILNKTSGFSARNLFMFSSRAGGGGAFEGRIPGSPRPASMASADMPRPSTDSGSIWGPPGDGAAVNASAAAAAALGKTNRLWPPDHAWSRNTSRRPSLHGSPSALKTNLASAEDEILDDSELLNPEASPSQVGVIGSRPPASSKKTTAAASLGKALNPAAPTFMANIFRPKTDKEKESGKDKDKDHKEKDKDKPKGKDKGKDKGKGRDKDKDKDKDSKDKDRAETPVPDTPVTTHAAMHLPSFVVEEVSPTNPRISRDGHSIHTQTTVSESRDSLDYTVSNTTSEPNSVGVLSSSKDSENALLKLFRKESAGKLSFTRRIGRAKGPGSSNANSDRNLSAAERSSFEDVGDESGSGRGGIPSGMESVTSSPSLGPSKSREKVESKLRASGAWFSIKKNRREKESLEIERERSLEAEPAASAVSVSTSSAAAATVMEDGSETTGASTVTNA